MNARKKSLLINLQKMRNFLSYYRRFNLFIQYFINYANLLSPILYGNVFFVFLSFTLSNSKNAYTLSTLGTKFLNNLPKERR